MLRRRKGQEIRKLQTSTPWGRALEVLRVDRKDVSLMQLEKSGRISRANYRKLVIGPEGPTCKTMAGLLESMHADWHDWAEAYEGRKSAPPALVAEEKASYGDDGFVRVPLLSFKAAAGGGAVIEDEIPIRELAFDRQWITTKLKANPRSLRALKVTGDSMEPTLCAEDVVLFDRAKLTPKHDHLFVLRQGEHALVKRLCLKGRQIYLHSDNVARYPEERIRPDEVQILGEVVWLAGRRM